LEGSRLGSNFTHKCCHLVYEVATFFKAATCSNLTASKF